jgi:hypothetical protein
MMASTVAMLKRSREKIQEMLIAAVAFGRSPPNSMGSNRN